MGTFEVVHEGGMGGVKKKITDPISAFLIMSQLLIRSPSDLTLYHFRSLSQFTD